MLSVDQIASFVSEGDENAEIKGKELSEPFNEQGFNPVIKNNNEPLSDTEGVSYRGGENRATIQQRDIAVPKTNPNASDFEPLPDFRNMTLPGKQLPNNKAEKSFFFDQRPNNLVEQIIMPIITIILIGIMVFFYIQNRRVDKKINDLNKKD